jgi:hypothetical protein
MMYFLLLLRIKRGKNRAIKQLLVYQVVYDRQEFVLLSPCLGMFWQCSWVTGVSKSNGANGLGMDIPIYYTKKGLATLFPQQHHIHHRPHITYSIPT